MRDPIYCVLITIIAIGGSLFIPLLIDGMFFGLPKKNPEYREYLALASLALLLPATIGIIRVQHWGFILLGVAYVTSLYSDPPLDYFSGSMWAFIGVRYCMSRNETQPDASELTEWPKQ